MTPTRDVRSLNPAAPLRSPAPDTAEVAPTAQDAAEKRRLLLMVRVALTVGVAALALYGNRNPATWQLLLVSAFLASNLAVFLVPARILLTLAFDLTVVLVDTTVTSVAMYASPQAGTDVLLLYFAIILIASIGDRLGLSLLACVMTSVAYLAFLVSHGGVARVMEAPVLLRFPFLLVVGGFYGFFVDRARLARSAAQQATARQRARTEFLATLTTDIQAPLASARKSASALRDSLVRDKDHARARAAEQILRNLRIVSDLVGLVSHEGAEAETEAVTPL